MGALIKKILCICCILSPTITVGQNIVYEVQKGTVAFHSVAANELIYASSDKLKGAIDIKKNTFLFKIDIGTFSGFNNQLQKEHFNENYMETSSFPQATYSGKIIEDIDLLKEGEYTMRAKGKLLIHGVSQEHIIIVHLVSKNGKIIAKADFPVLLADYNIKIPRIVSDKLSPEIKVSVNCIFLPNK
jgi:polyisoprenoid-binding protein YceI